MERIFEEYIKFIIYKIFLINRFSCRNKIKYSRNTFKGIEYT